MASGQITRYIPGRGLIVIGLKIPDANPNFILKWKTFKMENF
jgi:hypothetical protein